MRGIRGTHSFVTMEVSDFTFKEIENKLREAGYNHVFIDGAIDMHGIGLIKEKPPEPPAELNLEG